MCYWCHLVKEGGPVKTAKEFLENIEKNQEPEWSPHRDITEQLAKAVLARAGGGGEAQ